MIKHGLYDDEADAMLNTWDESYFKSPGKRVLFVVPKKWVDAYLPVQISVPAKIERVMIGRVDLVTQDQLNQAHEYLKKSGIKIDIHSPGFRRTGDVKSRCPTTGFAAAKPRPIYQRDCVVCLSGATA